MIAIMQPTFLPWMGYFTMIACVDKFIFLDSVQFERSSWQSRNKIKLQEKEYLLSLSCKKTPLQTKIQDITLNQDQRWKKKLLKTLVQAYSTSINFEKYFSYIERAVLNNSNLADLNIDLITYFCKELNIKTPLFRSSKLNLSTRKREEGLIDICKYFNDDFYLSPQGSKDYLETEFARKLFEDEKINIRYFNFEHPSYTQMGENFIKYLSIVDFLFNTKNPADEFSNLIRQNHESFI